MPTQAVILTWGGAFAMLVVAAFAERVMRARRLRRQRALCDLAALTWQQFEEVIADAFRRLGYRVQEKGGRNVADGGIDLVLTLAGRGRWCRRSTGGALG